MSRQVCAAESIAQAFPSNIIDCSLANVPRLLFNNSDGVKITNNNLSEDYHVSCKGFQHASRMLGSGQFIHSANLVQRMRGAICVYCTGDYKCDGCPEAKPRLDDRGFMCKPMDTVTLTPSNELETNDPAMQVHTL